MTSRALGMLVACFSLSAGCAPTSTNPELDASAPGDVGDSADSNTISPARLGYVVSSLKIQLPATSPDGGGYLISEGIDLDSSERPMCGHNDFPTPAGSKGVDNAFYAIWLRFPVFLQSVNGQGLEAVTQLLHRMPAEGGFSYAVTVDAPDGGGGERHLALRPLTVVPVTGTDAEVLAYQTVTARTDTLVAPGVATDDGRTVQASGVGFTFFFDTFGFAYGFDVRDARVRVERRDDGTATMRFAFGIPRATLVELARAYEDYFAYFDAELATGITPGMLTRLQGAMDLDMDTDGDCHTVSAQFEAELVPAFVR